MNYLKVSEFLTNECPFLYGAFYGFFRFSDDNKLFIQIQVIKNLNSMKNFITKAKKNIQIF